MGHAFAGLALWTMSWAKKQAPIDLDSSEVKSTWTLTSSYLRSPQNGSAASAPRRRWGLRRSSARGARRGSPRTASAAPPRLRRWPRTGRPNRRNSDNWGGGGRKNRKTKENPVENWGHSFLPVSGSSQSRDFDHGKITTPGQRPLWPSSSVQRADTKTLAVSDGR